MPKLCGILTGNLNKENSMDNDTDTETIPMTTYICPNCKNIAYSTDDNTALMCCNMCGSVLCMECTGTTEQGTAND